MRASPRIIAQPDDVTPGNVEDALIGGLGMLMVKRFIDEMNCEHAGGSDAATIGKKW